MKLSSPVHMLRHLGSGILLSLLLLIAFSCKGKIATETPVPIVVAYVDSKGDSLPDPSLMTHIIYAFAGFNETRDGLAIQKPERLKAIAALKKKNPALKVILSVGGYHEEGYSDMASTEKTRKGFVQSCKAVCDSLNLDGIDFDWEFPGTEAGGTKARPDDAHNYVEVARLLREALGQEAWLSVYSNNSGKWIDFPAMLPYLSYVNVSGYNLGAPPKHQSNLYASNVCGSWSIDKSIHHHAKLGVPREKILMGIPFFARGAAPLKSRYINDSQLDSTTADYRLRWDEEAKAPYKIGGDGIMIASFDNPESIAAKCLYIRDNGLAGAFYWHYDADYPDHRLAKAVTEGLLH